MLELPFKISRFFIILFILLSFITQSFGESAILFRITPPDIVGALAIAFFLLSGRCFSLLPHWHIGLFIIAMLITGLFGLNIAQSLIEVLVLSFLFLLFMLMISHFSSVSGILDLIFYFSMAGLFASLFGIYDLASEIVGLPRVFPGRTSGEVLSGFRNAGQAGHYAMIVISVLVPVRASKLFGLLTFTRQRLLTFSLLATFVFFLLTGKIAAYIGLAIGFTGFFLLQRSLRAFVVILLCAICLFVVAYNIDSLAPETANRILTKYNTRLGEVFAGKASLTAQDRFIGENIRLSLEAFLKNPVTGSGIGAFGGNIYSKYEVHSTYLKMLGEAGMVGVVGYLLFMAKFLAPFRCRSRGDAWQEFIYYLFPFILGCLVSWTYTYHMRKREFWIMAAIVAMVYKMIMLGKQNHHTSVKQHTYGGSGTDERLSSSNL